MVGKLKDEFVPYAFICELSGVIHSFKMVYLLKFSKFLKSAITYLYAQ